MLVISMKAPIRCCSLGKDVPSAARSLDWTTEFVEDPPMFGTQDYVSGPGRNICWGPCMAINSAAKCGLMARIIHQLNVGWEENPLTRTFVMPSYWWGKRWHAIRLRWPGGRIESPYLPNPTALNYHTKSVSERYHPQLRDNTKTHN